MNTQTYQILINSSYDELPKEAQNYVNRLVTRASKNSFVSKILKEYNDIAIKTDDIDVFCGTFIDVDQSRKVGCFWYLKIKIFPFVFSLLTGVTIPKLLKKNYCLFLQSLVIASHFVGEVYVNEPPYDWDYE